MRPSGRPLSKTDWSLLDAGGHRERRALQAGVRRVGEQVDARAGDPARRSRVPPSRAGSRPTGPRGRPGRRRPSRRRSAGRPPSSAAGSCRSDRPAGRRDASPHASRWASSSSSASGVDVGEVAGGAADPGALGEVAGLAGAAVVAGRLDVAEPQAGGGAEVGRGHLVVDEAVEDPARRSAPCERLAERRREGVVDVRCRCRRARRPSRRRASPATRSAASSAGEPARAAASAASTSAVTWAVVRGAAGHRPGGDPVAAAANEMTVTSRPCITPLVVRVLLAQRRLALVRVVHDHDAVVAVGGGQRVLDQGLGVTGGAISGLPRRWC